MTPTNPATCIILIGLPASGKSSLYHALFRETHVRINLDMLKTLNRERRFLEVCLQTQMPFVIDKVNSDRTTRAKYIKPAKEKGYKVVGYHVNVSRAESLLRNAGRIGKARVPNKAIYGFASRFEAPSYDEGFDMIYTVTFTSPTDYTLCPVSQDGSGARIRT